ncbi:pilus assembly protein CpaC [Collimonas sp. PA-H2]|uniref:pilus assembly protein N-terminal domain-containing protein n=1 Tax=Collimonas sp. PA-H2 TaxID=1881062 RepID=UPI000C01DDDA|nr:pilus assembly protein N-terminal domain-containing protein [Collimonas sp. PA-H2]PFH09436.1 pilus assembly protein CpaC [Collimonas sp. PA-H2]
MIKNNKQLRRFPVKPLMFFLALAFAGIDMAAFAQSVPSNIPGAEGNADKGSNLPLKNGYADTYRSSQKRSNVALNQPYSPIKKQDDQAQIPEIEMFVGESRVFPAPGVARIAVGNGQIMSAAALDNREVILFANGIGTSSLFIWNEDGRYQRVKINIVPGDTSRFAREIAAFLTTIPNTKASIIGDKVIVEGDDLADVDIKKIDDLAKRYPQIVNFTNQLGWEKMVLMDVKVVEFPKSELQELGLKWTSTGGAIIGGIWRPARRGNDGPYQINIQTGQDNPPPITAPGGNAGTGVVLPSALNILSAVNLGLNAQLNLLAQNGKATVLSEPQLSARNGSKASFLVGGEYPYSVSSINGLTVMFKPYGIKLDIEPRVDRNGVIRAKIESEVSSIDGSVITTAGPAISTRKTNTEFNVRNGETLVLSGLISRKSSNNIDKVPFLGDIPILGALFRSKRFQNDETELVVFVTPTVVDSNSAGLVDRVQRTGQRLEDNFGKQPYLTTPLQPGVDPARTGQPSLAPLHAPAAEDGDQQAVAPALTPVQPASIVPAQAGGIKAATGAVLVPAGQNPLQSGGSSLQVKTDGLIVRAEPNPQSRALLQLGRGSIVQMGGLDPQPVDFPQWRNVVIGAINGWVASASVEPSKLQPTIHPYAGSQIARPDQQGSLIGAGNPNLKPANATTVTANAKGGDANEAKRYRVTLNQLALRASADVNAPVIQQLASGSIVEGLPQVPNGYWSPVQVDGKRGWVATQWLLPVAAQ